MGRSSRDQNVEFMSRSALTERQIEMLHRLAVLKNAGALNEQEFAEQKAHILETLSSDSNVGSRPAALASGQDSQQSNVVPDWVKKTQKGRAWASPIAASCLALAVVSAGVTSMLMRQPAGKESHLLVVAQANVRDAPTSKGSTIVGRLSAGDRVSGTWGVGATNEERWLQLSGRDRQRYVWGGNLQADPQRRNGRAEVRPTDTGRSKDDEFYIPPGPLPKWKYLNGTAAKAATIESENAVMIDGERVRIILGVAYTGGKTSVLFSTDRGEFDCSRSSIKATFGKGVQEDTYRCVEGLGGRPEQGAVIMDTERFLNDLRYFEYLDVNLPIKGKINGVHARYTISNLIW